MLLMINGTWADNSALSGAANPVNFAVAPLPEMARPAVSVTLAEALTAVANAKQAALRRPLYLKSLKHYLHRFAAGRESRLVSEITVADVEQYLSRWENPRTRETQRNRISTLFSFAVRRGWAAKNPAQLVERAAIDQRAPLILTPAQSELLLRHCAAFKPNQFAFLVLVLLCGLRPSEAMKTTWSDVDLEAGTVRVDGAAAKTRRRRIVHMKGNTVLWMKLASVTGGRLPVPLNTARSWRKQWSRLLGFKAGWPPDIARHTCASMWLASDDAGKVSRELGNSPGVLLRHYYELVTKDDAARFWAIMP